MVGIALAIFVLALGLRLVGIGWGLRNDLHNQSYHPDEPLIFDFANKSQVYRPSEAEYYNYGTLYLALLRVSYAMPATYGGLPLPEFLDAPANLEQWNTVHQYASQSHLAGRVVSAILGAGTAAVAFVMLLPWLAMFGAIAASAVLALAPALVEHSRFQTVDVPSLFFITLATAACLRLLRLDIRKANWPLEIGVVAALVGLASSTRFTNGLLILSLLAALALMRPPRLPLLLGISVVAASLAFVATTPGVLFDWANFARDFQNQSQHASRGHGTLFMGTHVGYVMHLEHLLLGIGLIAPIGLIGIAFAAYRKHNWALVVLAFAIPYYVLIGSAEVKFLRYGFPMYLAIAVGVGYAISAIPRVFVVKYPATIVAILVWFAPTVRDTWRIAEWMTQEDPRDSAGRQLKSLATNDPNMTVGIIADPWFWTPAVVKDAMPFKPEDMKRRMLESNKSPRVVRIQDGGTPDYITYSSFEVSDLTRLSGRTDIDPTVAADIVSGNQLLHWIEINYELVGEYGKGGPKAHDMQYVQPHVWVWKRRAN